MKKRMMAAALALLMAMAMAAPGSADFGSAGNMVSPGVLVLIPENPENSRTWIDCSGYFWSYAPLFFKPDDRVTTGAEGAGLADLDTEDSTAWMKLAGPAVFTMAWDDGWAPDVLSITSWDSALFGNPGDAESLFKGAAEPEDGKITLEPGRIYRFMAEWVRDYPDEEYGEAEYILVTEQMTEEEAAAAKARVGAPFSEEDLPYLTLKIGDAVCVLGTTTPRDLRAQGLICEPDMDCFTIRMEDVENGDIYAYTKNLSEDEPIIALNAFWAYDMPLEYCGFDGSIGDPETDPDNTWLEEEYRWTAEDLREAQAEDDFENRGMWSGMVRWLRGSFHTEESVEGIYTAVITLSNGRELSISSHDSPVGLSLLPE